MTITQVTDHAAQALDNVLSQFDDAARLRKLVEVIGDEIQRFEDVAWAVLVATLDSATGLILDEFGMILEEPRGALGDDDYRRALKVIVATYQSDGTGPEVVYLAATLLGVSVWYRQRGRLAYEIEYETTAPLATDWLARVQRIFEAGRPAAAELSVIEGDTSGDPAGVPFTLDTDNAGLDDGELCRRIL